jgi:hypothetical protein
MNKGYNQNNMNYPNMPRDNRDDKDFMYPEVYNKFMPVAEQIMKEMEKQYGDVYLNEDMLRQMVDEAIRRSGIDNMSEMPDSDAVPTVNLYGRYGGRYHGRDGWRYYNRGALSDIFSILFLNQIFGHRRHHWR